MHLIGLLQVQCTDCTLYIQNCSGYISLDVQSIYVSKYLQFLSSGDPNNLVGLSIDNAITIYLGMHAYVGHILGKRLGDLGFMPNYTRGDYCPESIKTMLTALVLLVNYKDYNPESLKSNGESKPLKFGADLKDVAIGFCFQGEIVYVSNKHLLGRSTLITDVLESGGDTITDPIQVPDDISLSDLEGMLQDLGHTRFEFYRIPVIPKCRLTEWLGLHKHLVM